MVDDGRRETWREMGMGGTCGVAREGEGPQGVSFCFVPSLGSLLLVGL